MISTTVLYSLALYALVVAAPFGLLKLRDPEFVETHPKLLFLNNLTEEAKSEYLDLMTNETTTKAKKYEELEQWAVKNGVEKEHKDFIELIKSWVNESRKDVQALFENAYKLRQEIDKLDDDEQLTMQDAKRMFIQLFQKQPKEMELVLLASRLTSVSVSERLGLPDGPDNMEIN